MKRMKIIIMLWFSYFYPFLQRLQHWTNSFSEQERNLDFPEHLTTQDRENTVFGLTLSFFVSQWLHTWYSNIIAEHEATKSRKNPTCDHINGEFWREILVILVISLSVISRCTYQVKNYKKQNMKRFDKDYRFLIGFCRLPRDTFRICKERFH